ncbi:MAG: precorrin-4 C(11)-methyltransferase [Oscillospiraceae bacterium]
MVHFVGAGSGGADLITVRGAQLLKKADVIIYAGSLVNIELLTYAQKSCKLYDSAEMTLEQVIEVMVEGEKQNADIVRLHTGDPCLYGAIREQMDELIKYDIEYDYTPGVSSFCGAAAALKTEYTLPNVSQTVIITRMEGRTAMPDREKMSMLAQHGSTMVIFLSTGLIPQLVNELTQGAYTKDTAAAIVYKATWPEEKVYRCTIGTLEQTAKDNNITKTALITVGDFLTPSYERSKLYDPSFTTEFRQGTEKE